MIDGCRMTVKCQEHGYCLAHEGACRANEGSCKASLFCQMSGYCSVQKDGVGCVVGTNEDCLGSDACKVRMECLVHRGRCVQRAPEPAESAPPAE